MKRHSRFIIATVLCLPFCAFIVIYLVALVLRPAHIPDLIGIPLLTGLYWLSQWPLIALLVLFPPTVSVILAWCQSLKAGAEIIATGIYSVVIALHICAALWCVVTRPAFDL
jgi:hypothetical protein